MKAVGLMEVAKGADFVFTGEGVMGRQTFMGRTLSGVAQAVVGTPIVAFTGSLGKSVEELCSRGFVGLVLIVADVTTLEETFAGGRGALTDAAERAVRLLLAGAARSADLL